MKQGIGIRVIMISVAIVASGCKKLHTAKRCIYLNTVIQMYNRMKRFLLLKSNKTSCHAQLQCYHRIHH